MIGAARQQEQAHAKKRSSCTRNKVNSNGEGREASERLQEECGSCGICKEVCPFLESYGRPDEIIAARTPEVFLCTTCGACNSACPMGLAPSEALLELKEDLLRTGGLPQAVRKALRSARSYANWGGRLPFTTYDAAETVFWPGCDLAAAGPEIVQRTVDILGRSLGTRVGLALDCCFDPPYQMGDRATTERAAKRIRKRLERHGIRRVITGCGNCAKVFATYLPETDVIPVLEALPPGSVTAASSSQEKIYLHHPCPSFRFEGLRERTRELLSDHQAQVQEPDLPVCCGLGGGVHKISPEMSRRFTERVGGSAAGSFVVTSCMACTDRFREHGMEARHVLELAAGITPRASASPLRKWLRRLALATRTRLRIR